MCGIVGMAGNLTYPKEKAFRTLLILDSLRGEDSTGIAVVHKTHTEPDVVKSVGNPFELFDTKAYDNAMRGANRVLIGHNRFATTGSVNKKNAHPFTIGSITGVHNGTLSNKTSLHDGYKFDVDSQALYNHINEKGLHDAIKTAGGAWALVWWDSKASTLNFLRNKERTLYMCYEEGGDTVYWASEDWMLHVALTRNNIKFTKPFLLDEDTHFKVTVDQAGKLLEWEEEEVKSSYVPFQPQVNTYGRQGWNNGPGPQAQTALAKATQQQTTTPTTSGSANSQPSKVVAKVVQGYAGRTQQRLRCISLASDEHGGQYIHCEDVAGDTKCHIRLYINKNEHDKTMVGKEILADISNCAYTFMSPSGTGYFYKAVYSSVRLADVKKGGEDLEVFKDFHQNHKGVLISKEAWKKQYGECSCCGVEVNPEDNLHKFTREGAVICGACITDPQLEGYLPSLH